MASVTDQSSFPSPFIHPRHNIPRFNIAGYQKPIPNKPLDISTTATTATAAIAATAATKPKANLTQCPQWWAPTTRSNSIAPTRTRLLEERRKKKLPDISFDLDGDGVVGDRDYVISTRFDQDLDGRLNTSERRTAMNALKSDYENHFMWGVEKSGVLRGERVLQVRGKIVDAGDYREVEKTYPLCPITEIKAQHETVAELKEKRKQELM